MPKKLIAVILGGSSAERPVSIKTGSEVARAIDRKKYEVILLDGARLSELINLEGEKFQSFEQYLSDYKNKKIDLAFIALHGSFGEDGELQQILDKEKIRYTFSDAKSSRIAMNKVATKKVYQSAGILVAPEMVVESIDFNIDQAIDMIGLPTVVKPVEQGSSFGVSIVKNKKDLAHAITEALKFDKKVMLEKFINGTEITVAVAGNYKTQAFPVIEIRPKGKSEFFDYYAKYNESGCDEICPAEISSELTKEAQKIGQKAHLALGCSGISRTDMIIESRTNKIYTLETNTIPGMTPASLLPKAAKAAGYSFEQLIELIISLAFEKK